MTRLAESVLRHPMALAIAAAGLILPLILPLIVGLEYGPGPGLGNSAVRGSLPIAPRGADDATDPHKISVLDEPRPLPHISLPPAMAACFPLPISGDASCC